MTPNRIRSPRGKVPKIALTAVAVGMLTLSACSSSSSGTAAPSATSSAAVASNAAAVSTAAVSSSAAGSSGAAASSAPASSAATGGAVAASTATTPANLTTVNFVFDWIPTTGDVPVLAAQKFGWFAQEGLTVKTTPGGPGVGPTTLVSAGQQDITIAPPTAVMAARANGAPLVSVALTQPTGPTGLVCNPTVGIDPNKPSTLDGRKIGFSNNANDAIQTKWMAANGVDVTTIKKVQTGSDLSLMFAGQVDCQPNFLTLIPLQAQDYYKKAPVIFKTSDIGAVGQSIVTSESYLSSHLAQVKGFNTAYAKGMQWALKNPAAAVALVKATYSDYDAKNGLAELTALQKFWVGKNTATKGLLWFDQSMLEPTYNVIKGTEWLTSDIDLSKAFSTTALPDPAILP